MHDLSSKIHKRIVHVFCDINNRIISAEEAEEEQIQRVKEINDIKKNKRLVNLSIKGCF